MSTTIKQKSIALLTVLLFLYFYCNYGVISTALGILTAVNIPTVTNIENEHTPLTLGQNQVSLCANLDVTLFSL